MPRQPRRTPALTPVNVGNPKRRRPAGHGDGASLALGWSGLRGGQAPRTRHPASVAGQACTVRAHQAGAMGTDVVFDLITAHHKGVNIVAAGRSEADVRRVLTHPVSVR